MYLDRLVDERAQQEVKIENMSLDLEAAQNTIMTLEAENQRLREASGELEAKPLKRRRVSTEPEDVPAIDAEPKADSRKSEASPKEDLTSAPDSVPDLNIAEIEDEASPSAVDAKPASLKRSDEPESAPDAAPDDGGSAFMPKDAGAAFKAASDEELPEPPADMEGAPTASSDTSNAVSAIAIDKTQTRGEDLDGKPGDEGVLVVLQPRDSTGKYVTQVGSVVIELIDSPTVTKSDTNAQVAEWKFTQEEVRRAMRNSTLGRGAYLQVDWDEHIPANSKLLIIAHWTTPSGEELSAQQVVKVNLARGARAWDPRPNGSPENEQPAASVATRPSSSASSTSTSDKAWAPTRR